MFTIIQIVRDGPKFALFIKPEEMYHPQILSQISHILTGSDKRLAEKLLYPVPERSEMHRDGATNRLFICIASRPERLSDWISDLQGYLPPNQFTVLGGETYYMMPLPEPQEGQLDGFVVALAPKK